MEPIPAEYYHRLFTSAADLVQFKVDTCRTIPGRAEAESTAIEQELTAIEEELTRLRTTANGRDLAFWRSDQADDLHTAVEQLDQRVKKACL